MIQMEVKFDKEPGIRIKIRCKLRAMLTSSLSGPPSGFSNNETSISTVALLPGNELSLIPMTYNRGAKHQVAESSSALWG